MSAQLLAQEPGSLQVSQAFEVSAPRQSRSGAPQPQSQPLPLPYSTGEQVQAGGIAVQVAWLVGTISVQSKAQEPAGSQSPAHSPADELGQSGSMTPQPQSQPSPP